MIRNSVQKEGELFVKGQKNLSDAERKYKTFHKQCQFIIYPLLVPILVLSFTLIFAKDDGMMLISALLLIVWTAVVTIVCTLVGKKRSSLEKKLWEERNAVKRTGIFKELYDEFRHDGFEFHICSDKFLFDDCHRNIIECAFLKNGHEFSVMIDENAVSILVDEETNRPVELEKPLSEMKSIGYFYQMINGFVSEHSDT